MVRDRQRTLRVVICLSVLLLTVYAAVFRIIHIRQQYFYRELMPYTVQAGDTLWRIAGQADLPGDIRYWIDEIEKVNGVRAGGLQPGMVLKIPVK